MLAVLGLLVPAEALARGPALNWVRLPGAESCIAAVELAQQVEARLGRPVFVRSSEAVVVIEGRVEPAPPIGFTAVVRVSDPDGTLYGSRELTSADADCRKLDEVLALVISVTIRRGGSGSGIELPEAVVRELDRLFEQDSSELDPASLPAAPPAAIAPSPPPAASVVDEPEPASRDAGLSIGILAGLFGAVGLQPGFGFGPQVALQLELAEVGSLALVGRIGFTTEQQIEDGTLAYRPLQAALAFCAWPWHEGTTELGLCGAGAVGSMRVAASGFTAYSGTVYEIWVEAIPQLVGRTVLLAPLFLELVLGAPLRIVVPDFRYTDSSGRTRSAFSMSRVGFMLELSAGVRF